MTLAELFEQVKDLPPETPVCVAEVDEAAGANVDGVEIVRSAALQSDAADGRRRSSSEAERTRWSC